MPKKEETAVAKVKPAGQLAEQDEFLSMFHQDAFQGLENIKKEDTAIPFLRILQSNSPEVEEDGSNYVDGARPGMVMNTVTKELYEGKEGVLLIPIHFEKVYLEWRPRDTGGGFVAQYATREDGESSMEEGNDLVDTANHYVLVKTEDDTWAPALLSCKSTFMRASRNWNAQMQNLQLKGPNGPFTPPSFACIYSLTTRRESNDKGSWYNITIERVGLVNDREVYAMAKAFRETLVRGEVKVVYTDEVEDLGSVSDAADLPKF